VLSIADKFAVGVDSSPETIECRHQNRPMAQIDKNVDLKTFPDDVDEQSKLNLFRIEDF